MVRTETGRVSLDNTTFNARMGLEQPPPVLSPVVLFVMTTPAIALVTCAGVSVAVVASALAVPVNVVAVTFPDAPVNVTAAAPFDGPSVMTPLVSAIHRPVE